MRKFQERIVSENAPMRTGYAWVPKGNQYITMNCRRRVQEANGLLFVVHDSKGKVLGLRVPKHICRQVRRDEAASRGQRKEAVRQRDATDERKFSDAVLAAYPKIPPEALKRISKHACRKHSRRVGRTGTIEIGRRAELAVRAHIRHHYTQYDQLLARKVDRSKARDETLARVDEVGRSWGSRSERRHKAGHRRRRDKKDASTPRRARRGTKNGAQHEATPEDKDSDIEEESGDHEESDEFSEYQESSVEDSDSFDDEDDDDEF